MAKPVIIVGAGVVGSLLGKFLKQKKIPFVILEEKKSFELSPARTVALTKDSVSFLNSVDRKININQWGTPVKKMQLYQDKNLNTSLNYADQTKLTTICSLDKLSSKFHEGLDGDIHWNSRIEEIKECEDSIIVKARDKNIEGSVLFATDGSNSKVRAMSNFDTEEWFYGQRVYIARIKYYHENIARQYFLKSGTLDFLPFDDCYSVIFCTNTNEDPRKELISLLQRFDLAKASTKIEPLMGGIELKHVRAKKLFSNRIVLCGDASNSFHPMAGQSLNLGIGDIMQISYDLKAIVNADNNALEKYNKTRNKKNLQMTWIIQSLFGAFSNMSGISELMLSSGMKFLDKFTDAKETIIDFANKN